MNTPRLSIPTSFPPLVIGSVATAAQWQDACAAAPACDVVEVRADGYVPADLSACPLPVLLTVRCAEEGGLRTPFPTEERAALALRLLPQAAALDWEIAHLAEVPELVAAAHAAGVPVIASAHNFERTPALADCLALESHARAAGADVVKFAFRLNAYEDMQLGVDLLRRAAGPMAVMGMGPLGAVSRLVYAQHGSALVYGYLGTVPTAPGQWSAALCKDALASLCAEKNARQNL